MNLAPKVCTFSHRDDADAFLLELRLDPYCLPAGPVTHDDGQFSVRYFGALDLRRALERYTRLVS